MPAYHTTVIDGERCVGYNEVLVDANNLSKALTLWTGSYGRVEREQVVGRFFKGYAVSLKAYGEIVTYI
jgi:hypothetical protein